MGSNIARGVLSSHASVSFDFPLFWVKCVSLSPIYILVRGPVQLVIFLGREVRAYLKCHTTLDLAHNYKAN